MHINIFLDTATANAEEYARFLRIAEALNPPRVAAVAPAATPAPDATPEPEPAPTVYKKSDDAPKVTATLADEPEPAPEEKPAPKPKRARKPRKSAKEKARESAAARGKAAAAKAAKEIKQADVVEAVRNYANVKGIPATVELLQNFGVSRATDIKPEAFAEVMEALSVDA